AAEHERAVRGDVRGSGRGGAQLHVLGGGGACGDPAEWRGAWNRVRGAKPHGGGSGGGLRRESGKTGVHRGVRGGAAKGRVAGALGIAPAGGDGAANAGRDAAEGGGDSGRERS